MRKILKDFGHLVLHNPLISGVAAGIIVVIVMAQFSAPSVVIVWTPTPATSATPPLPPMSTRPLMTATSTLPVIPTGATLTVYRTVGGTALCAGQEAIPLADIIVSYAIGTSERYVLAQEFPDQSQIAAGTCVCMPRSSIPDTLPSVCARAHIGGVKTTAGQWLNAQLQLTFQGRLCVIIGNDTEETCRY